MSDRKCRIGGFSAFWGDAPNAAEQIVEKGGHIDYLIGDYLAEVTMCILARVKQNASKKKNAGEGGYVAEFVKFVWLPLMKPLMERNIKVITNAGGMNPLALKTAIEEAAKKAGVTVPKVGVVFGDDLTPTIQSLKKESKLKPFSVFTNAEEAFWSDKERLASSNAYFGATAIRDCLAQGCQIVVTGRVVDSALVLGPLMHEFGWCETDYDLLSAGSLAGHIIECGAQCTGGNFTDWRDSSENGWDDMGFPIAECYPNGSVIVCKTIGTGGLVTFGSVVEQMIYEVLDPANYMLPDVVCDWTNVTVKELAMTAEEKNRGQKRSDRVLVTNAKGKPPSRYYKVVPCWSQGSKLVKRPWLWEMPLSNDPVG